VARTAAPRTTRRFVDDDEDASGGGRFGDVLRGSMSSLAGTVGGLNLPLRTVERLTKAVERAAVMLERIEDAGGSTRVITLLKRADRISKSVEQATKHLDKLDPNFVKRLDTALAMLVEMRQDTAAMRARLDSLEVEVRGVQTVLTDRLDRVPLMRPSRRERKAAQAADANQGT